MSLVDQNKSFGVRDYLFLAAGFLAALWFFFSYASQDPRTAMQTTLDKNSATLKGAEVLNLLGYSTGDLNAKADFNTNSRLLDSLQLQYGRAEAIRTLSDSIPDAVYPFYWQISFEDTKTLANVEDIEPENTTGIGIRLDGDGQWIELVNERRILPEQRLNRKALQYAFKEDSARDLWKSVPDSAWDGVLSFDVENGYELARQDDPEVDKDTSFAHVFSIQELKRLAEFYLESSVWNHKNFELQDVQFKTYEDLTGAELKYRAADNEINRGVNLTMKLAPTGALVELNADYNLSQQGASSSEILELVRIAVFFLFGVVALVTFFLRMRARAVDTKSALVVSILAGFLIPVVIFLQSVETIDLFDGNITWFNLIDLGLAMGVMGGIGSVAFFIIASIGDSMTRQLWQHKLTCYDYIRQGMLFNRPVGEALLRSVVLMFFLAGFWSLLLWVIPGLYVDLDLTFIVYEAAWPPLYMLLNSAWFSLITMLGIFLVAGSLILSRVNSRWAFALVTTLAVAIVVPLPFSYGSASMQLIAAGLIGIALTIIYLKWDVLTLLISHFLFLNLLMASSGWIVSSSADLYVFIFYVLFLLFITGWAVISIVKGKEDRALPDYVPEYVEELAQEERIKQELQIAREVQQSFLPTQTPDFSGLDIAALCQPAYETGGDYYDFIQLDDHRIAVTIGDVSGKGIQAAFYMTFTKGILHSLCHETDSPAELLKKTNRLFFDNAKKGTFISLVYGIIDLKKKTFTFSRAGHNPILHLNGQNGKLQELQPNGLGIGLTKEAQFDNNIKEVELSLTDEDLLVLYTDGVVEALDSSHQFYGDKRLSSLLENHKKNSSNEILKLLSEDVRQFIGTAKQHDDMTIMVIKFNGTESKNS